MNYGECLKHHSHVQNRTCIWYSLIALMKDEVFPITINWAQQNGFAAACVQGGKDFLKQVQLTSPFILHLMLKRGFTFQSCSVLLYSTDCFSGTTDFSRCYKVLYESTISDNIIVWLSITVDPQYSCLLSNRHTCMLIPLTERIHDSRLERI